MKKFFKTLDRILGILLIIAFVGGVAYVKFINPDALKPTYTITLKIDGAPLEQDTYSMKKGSTLTLPTPTREGYTFDGWFDGDTLWTADSVVTADTELTAKWTPKKYTVTFVVDDVEYDQLCDYDSIPEFDGIPTKSPTARAEYVFSGWTPEISKVTGRTTYTAIFSEQIRKFEISISSNLPNAGTITGAGIYEYGATADITLEPENGYAFVGWFKNGVPYSTDTNLSIGDISEDLALEAQFALIKKSITYHDYHGTLINPTSYDITYGVFDLLPQNQNGYSFMGWFTSSNGEGENITSINSEALLDYDLYAHYIIQTYTITYNLNDGEVSGTNKTTYQVTDEFFTLINPTKENYTFIGWSGTGLSALTKNVTIAQGSYGNRTYTANWQPLYVDVSFVVDDMELTEDELTLNRGETLSLPSINSAHYGMSGYSVVGWFKDESLITPFDATEPIKNDLVLYGTWKYLLNDGFYSQKTRFDTAVELETLSLTSADTETDLVEWIEYVAFYSITTRVNIQFDSSYKISSSTENGLKTLVSALIHKSNFASSTTLGYSYLTSGGNYTLKSIFFTDDAIKNGSLVADPSKNYTYDQLDYALLKTTSGRNNDFNNFNIYNVKNTISVTTSNQLVYAFEKGLNPIPVSGSDAEILLEKAKAVLREICDDTMTDLQKTRAIYDWLIQNVSYDHYAASEIANSDVPNYDSWMAEGVFNNNKAVCDGYAKAFVILAKLENIPAIRVTGNAHAWNKVYLNGKWFGIDATHGDSSLNGTHELHTYTSFLFTDAMKTAKGYSTSDYAEVVANTTFDYYSSEIYTVALSSADLMINSVDEFNVLMNSLSDYTYTSSYFTIEIAIDSSLYASLNSGFGGALSSLFYNSSKTHSYNLHGSVDQGTDNNGNYIFTLLLYKS